MASRFNFMPDNAQFPTSNFPVVKKDAQGRTVLAFDAATAESCFWSAVAPQNYTGDPNIAVVVSYYMASSTTTTHNVMFTANIEAPSSSEDLDAGSFFAAGNWVRAPVPSATAGHYSQATIVLTPAQADNLAAGQYFRLKLERTAANTLIDTASGDCHVIAVELRDAA